jgi:hypothetical protein
MARESARPLVLAAAFMQAAKFSIGDMGFNCTANNFEHEIL